MATFEEAHKQSLKYFKNDELAANVFITKYAINNPRGGLEETTPEDMHRRLASEFARIEGKFKNGLSEEAIYQYLKDFKYIIPQGSPMAGVGNPYQVMSLSNCFVIEEPYDSYGGILKTDQEQAQLMKRRGGVGFDISSIRPQGLLTANAARTTDGIAVFMDRFSNTCREVGQGGRRGALMLSISVHHPEIRTFINIKRDRKRVTGANISIRLSDEFMNAVKKGQEVQLRWPITQKVDPKVEAWVDAAELWHEIIESAHESAEPGLLFWDTVKKYSPADAYESVGFGTVSTNPCFSSDTLIALADGRDAVSIKQLADEGKDVLLYSVNPKNGHVEIKTGRNPRLTNLNQKLLKITLDDGTTLRVTPNHKMILRDGQTKNARDLVPGDSLPSFSKTPVCMNKSGNKYYQVKTETRSAEPKKRYEHRLIAEATQGKLWTEKYQAEKQNGWVKGGLVVHHKDYDGTNNDPDNLEIMTFREHQQFHATHDNNGSNNGKFLGKKSKEIYKEALNFTQDLGRRFSHQEWQDFAKNKGLPQTFSKMHHAVLGRSPAELSMLCASTLGYEHTDKDPRLVRTLQEMIRQGYEAFISDNTVQVKKECETCATSFVTEHNRREISFCTHACSLEYVNSDQSINAKRTKAINRKAKEKAELRMRDQIKIWSSLQYELGRKPLAKEWETACKQENVPFRLGQKIKHGFKSYSEVCDAGIEYNHKIVLVEEVEGTHSVYNITVDDSHTVGIITGITGQQDGTKSFKGTFAHNCGEITLSPYDSCRLLLVNSVTFVKNPFTAEAAFDWEEFANVVQDSQRLMDDLVELELEAIDRILAKIDADPEPPDVKKMEADLWNKIRTTAENGRRTGLGLTAVGDAVAAMNVVYGSPESIELINEIYKNLALNSHRSSVKLAEERGAFPVYDYELEKDHPFINRIMDLDPEMKKSWQKYGRRNIANTTTAPAGSVSVLTQTTSGIEPAFMLSYKRRRKINPGDHDARVDFVDDMGDKWQEYTVYHHWFKKWMEVTGKSDPKDSPYHGATSNDINWLNKVKAQAAAQQWVCHSISNTTNVPEDTTVDTIKDIYMAGWETGCKGVTVYRDKCRTGVLVSEDESRSSDKFAYHHAPKRPGQLPCDIYHMQVRGEKWNFFVGIYDDKPYEIFAGRSEHIHLPRSRKRGVIKKNGTYNLYTGEGENELVIKDLASVFANTTESAFTRTVSLALRHGAPVQYVTEQIEKGADKDNEMFTMAKGLMRVLKHYIENGTKPSLKKCPNCSSKDLAYQEGCITCQGCGHSKCG